MAGTAEEVAIVANAVAKWKRRALLALMAGVVGLVVAAKLVGTPLGDDLKPLGSVLGYLTLGSMICFVVFVGYYMAFQSRLGALRPPPPPYGTSPIRWVRPFFFALLLVGLGEVTFAILVGLVLLFLYLPASLLFGRFKGYRAERLTRLAIYLSAVLLVFALNHFRGDDAEEKAARLIKAIESYQSAHGRYPDRLDQLVPQFIPEIPAKARNTFMDRGFMYFVYPDSHQLQYTVVQPFGRRYYKFEEKEWGYLD